MSWAEIILLIIRNFDTLIKPILILLDLPTNIDELLKNINKGDSVKMSKLFYEILNVKEATDVKNAYETAVANNKKYYRCITQRGKVVGWNGSTFIDVKRAQEECPQIISEQEGKTWFVNPEYTAPAEEQKAEQNTVKTIDQQLESTLTPLMRIADLPNYTTPIQPIQTVQPTMASAYATPSAAAGLTDPSVSKMRESVTNIESTITNMKVAYENSLAELAAARTELTKKNSELAQLQLKYDELVGKYNILAQEENTARSRLMDLKGNANKIITFLKEACNG